MPGTRCAVFGCKNSLVKTKADPSLCHVRYHKFPTDSAFLKVWVHRCQRQCKWNPRQCCVCSEHFTADDYERDMVAELLNIPPKRILKKDAVPSQKLGEKFAEVSSGKTSERNDRYERRQRKEYVNQILKEHATEFGSEVVPQVVPYNVDDGDQVADVIDVPNDSTQQTIQELVSKVCKLQEEKSAHEAEEENLKFKISLMEKEKALCVAQAQRMELKLSRLKKELSESRLEPKQLKQQLRIQKGLQAKSEKNLNALKTAFGSIFTESQMSFLINRKHRGDWGDETIAMALTIRYLSKRVYLYLRNTLHYPLPGVSTLQRWETSFTLERGILINVLNVMRVAGYKMKDSDKIAVLAFDEMEVQSCMEYDKKRDDVIGPHSRMQVVIARGLFSSWKQPVFVDFDKPMTAETLQSIIIALHNVGFVVTAFVSDMEDGNLGLWYDMNISADQPWIPHPCCEGRKVFFFVDAPLLLTEVRDRLVKPDGGFILKSTTVVDVAPFEQLQLIASSSEDYGELSKLTDAHVSWEDPQKENVQLAAELLSHTVATALRKYVASSEHPGIEEVADFVETVNFWFDIMNSSTPETETPLAKSGYGLDLDRQNDILDRTYEVMSSLVCIGEDVPQPFQMGFLVGINSLKGLLVEMNGHYQMPCVLTRYLNLECVQNFFSKVCCQYDDDDDLPTPLCALRRIRLIVLGKHPRTVFSLHNIF